MIPIEDIEVILGLICEPNTAKETRIYLKDYNMSMEKSGSIYTAKEITYGYELLG